MAMIAFTAMRRNPKLLECSRESIVGAIMTAAMLGLEPSGPLGHGALIPYNGECQFQPMYQGLLDLARRSGFIRDVQLRAVFKGDNYSYRFGLDPDITHIPLEGEGADDPEREPTHVYCIIRMVNGGVQWDQMSYAQGVAHGRKYSPSYDRRLREFKKGSVWADNPLSMIMKTILKRVLKLCPKSPEMSSALFIDDLSERGKTTHMEKIGDGVYDFIESESSENTEQQSNHGVLDITSFRAGQEQNRGHGQEGLDQMRSSSADPDAQLADQLQASLDQVRCTPDDFMDIETIAHDAGVSMKDVTQHVMQTMGFTQEYGHLTKNRKAEVIAWINAKRRP